MSEKTEQSAINEWFASLSHDLRNPVHGILSYAGFGIKKIDNGQLTEEKSLHYYQSIQDAGKKLLALLDEITLLAKLDAGQIPLKIVEWNLVTVVQGVISGFSKHIKGSNITIILKEPESTVMGRFDSKQVGDVVRRYLETCLQTADENTELTLTIDTLDASQETNPLNGQAIRVIGTHPDADYTEQKLNDLKRVLNHGKQERAKSGKMGSALPFVSELCVSMVEKPGLKKGRRWN